MSVIYTFRLSLTYLTTPDLISLTIRILYHSLTSPSFGVFALTTLSGLEWCQYLLVVKSTVNSLQEVQRIPSLLQSPHSFHSTHPQLMLEIIALH